MKLIVQGDDFGFTKGVTYGIIEAIDNGVLTTSGMFVNMEIAPWVSEFVKARPDFCFGVDFNLVAGPCVSNPKLIPHLVDKNGKFIRSNIRIKDPLWKTEEGREIMFPFDEVYSETKAQYDKFVTLTGRKPGYLNGHSLVTETMEKAIKKIGAEENIPVFFDYEDKFFFPALLPDEVEDDVDGTKVFNPVAQLNKNPLKKFMSNTDEILKHEYVMWSGHPGFIDADLFENTSLSIERCRDLEFVMSKEFKDFIKENHVELIDYRDIYNK